MDDNELVLEFLKTQNPKLFERLVDRYKDRIFNLAASVLGPGLFDEAEQVTQEVFLKVYRQLPAFRMQSTFGTWLYRITYHQAIDCKKTARFRLPHVSEEELDLPLEEMDADDPVKQLMTLEQNKIISDCVNRLPDLYRSVLNLYYWLGRSVKEIGEYHGVPEGTVKSYLHRARKKLFVDLKKRGFSYD